MRARMAWALACLTAVFVVADVAVTAAYSSLFSEEAVAVHGFPFTQLAVLGSALMGAVILSRYERHAVGVLLSMIGVLSSFSLVTEAYHVWVIDEGGPGPANLAAVAGWLSSLTGGQLAFAQLAVMFLLAPDGHFLSRRWRWAAGVIGVGALICSLVLMTMNPMEFDLRDADVGGVRGPAFTLGFFMIAGGLVAALVSMWIRLRRSTGEERQQVRLIALAVAALVVGLANMLIVQNLNGGEQTWVASLPLLVAYVLLPVTFSLAALRYRLYDIEVVINRTRRARGRLRVRRRRLHDGGRGGRAPGRHAHQWAAALVARDGARRAGLPAAATRRDQGGQPDRVRRPGPALRGALGLQPAAGRHPDVRRSCCPPSPRRPAAPWPRGVRAASLSRGRRRGRLGGHLGRRGDLRRRHDRLRRPGPQR